MRLDLNATSFNVNPAKVGTELLIFLGSRIRGNDETRFFEVPFLQAVRIAKRLQSIAAFIEWEVDSS